VLTDRSQGGSSVNDGDIELMVSCEKINIECWQLYRAQAS